MKWVNEAKTLHFECKIELQYLFEMYSEIERVKAVVDGSNATTWDAILLIASILTFVFYHVWYYSWRFTNLIEARGFHRVDLTGQRAREIFVRSIVSDLNGGNAEAVTQLAVQVTRNPITAASILATGTTVGATTLVGILYVC